MAIKQEIIDEFLSGYKTSEGHLGDNGIFKELKKALQERALSAELSAHFGYEKGDLKGRKTGNSRHTLSATLQARTKIFIGVGRD